MDDNNDTKDIVTADIKDPVDDKNQAVILLNLEGLIKSNISSIEKLQEELKKNREMLNNVFENDATYREHSERAKEASKVKGATRAEIMKQPSVINLSNKVKSMAAEIKERQTSLSDYLQEYERMAGTREIEGEDGEIREIVYEVKLIKKSSKFRT